MRPEDSWETILDPGERVLWQGQPDATPDWSGLRPARVIAGLGITLFSLFWTILASQAVFTEGVVGLIFPVAGLFFVYQGVKTAGGHVLLDSYRRRRTWYSLTSKRAFIATDIWGKRRLDSYPIGPDTLLDHDLRSPGSIWFAGRHLATRRGSIRSRIGFERLADSDAVMRLMTRIQSERRQDLDPGAP